LFWGPPSFCAPVVPALDPSSLWGPTGGTLGTARVFVLFQAGSGFWWTGYPNQTNPESEDVLQFWYTAWRKSETRIFSSLQDTAWRNTIQKWRESGSFLIHCFEENFAFCSSLMHGAKELLHAAALTCCV